MSWRFAKSLSSIFSTQGVGVSTPSESISHTPQSEPATPTVSSPPPPASDVDEQTYPSSPTRPGVLSITVFEGSEIEVPRSLASLAGASGQMALPYVVLEFDKNEVLILATGGDISAPRWRYTANFDVSRSSEVRLHVYIRTSAEGHNLQSGRRPSDAIIGKDDIYIGSVSLVPSFEDPKSSDQWYALDSGHGQVHVGIAFKQQTGKSLSIESFELLKVIGKGSFGKVMQVRKRDTARIYALKTIRKAHIISRSEVTHTLAERTVLARVNCPFIVPLKFSFQSPDKLYLVLAFVNGGELFLHLQQEGNFSEERSRFYAAELFCAIEHLHGFHVIYRDLKPENILLDYTGHIALCDFGLCKLNMGDEETTHTFCGTPEYLAPELLIGQGYTKSVDWWTLGVLLYEMLVGLPPFYSEDVNEMYRKILQEPLTFPPTISAEARDILSRLLRRDASNRLGSGPQGAAEIKNHPFFTRHIDWPLLMAKKLQPPFKPDVSSAYDTSNFDPEFTSETPLDSVVDDSHMISATVQEQFAGFSYNAAYDGSGGESLRY
ncbi:non-specific serine/threonine protein kinase [Malassezia cuniculi]|uniref:non-specific serine/threonine protein kinase n=1 Tax=Malassezia cuniculi TaxID=948313 RepID=A0AAF0EV47_9BASI|nr:non-specific serine/threonine protein kinase [Malassezia cuniculi]